MNKWYIESNGNRHEFSKWTEATRAWDLIKAEKPGDAYLCRINGTLIDCA